ncbi:MAG TPA: GNAT family N-acetyltransferase [Rhizomicrobium sp.]|nr:GNAT family N-acetyltransferase [Rhizomicrobium sp.]
MIAPELVPIPESDKSILANDLQHYIAELAPYDRALPKQGPYEYPGFDTLWSDGTRALFWARLNGEIAGFAIVHPENGVTDMADFYIRPAFRRHRVGRAFALAVIARFPGPWTLTQYKAKADSIAFWRSVIGERPFAEEDYVSANGNPRVKQSFVA